MAISADSSLVFAYSSNLSRRQMQSRCPNARAQPAPTLSDFALIFQANRRGRYRANVRHEPGAKTIGGLYKVSSHDLSQLDINEGHPGVYRRKVRLLHTANDQAVAAWIYAMVAQKPLFGAPDPEYFEIIERGYIDWSLNAQYLEKGLDRTLNLSRLKVRRELK